uniref:Uncharacterized protein n=1 Tax=Arundo donax TaxID=35708 RepID=A0A0A9FB35_ARUDO
MCCHLRHRWSYVDKVRSNSTLYCVDCRYDMTSVVVGSFVYLQT